MDGSNQIDSWNGTYGYGFKASAQSSRYGNATTDIIQGAYAAYGPVPTALTNLATNANTTGQDTVSIDYLVRIDPTQPAGTYTDTVTYIATATY
jgi:hypothetical protein